MKELENKIIVKVELNDENTSLVFTTDTGERITYYAYGDCCSSSWFAHISGIRYLLNNKIEAVDQSDSHEPTPSELAEGDYDVLDIYSYDLKTNKGTCYIEFRNDSNGYYGGSADLTTLSKEDEKQLRNIDKDF